MKILKTNILISSLEILFVVRCLLILDENYDIYYAVIILLYCLQLINVWCITPALDNMVVPAVMFFSRGPFPGSKP